MSFAAMALCHVLRSNVQARKKLSLRAVRNFTDSMDTGVELSRAWLKNRCKITGLCIWALTESKLTNTTVALHSVRVT